MTSITIKKVSWGIIHFSLQKFINIIFVRILTITFIAVVITACSTSHMGLVSKLCLVEMPDVESSLSGNGMSKDKLLDLHLKNIKIIDGLTYILKNKYLQKSNQKSVFDVHSLTNRVYISMSKLEQARLINEQYYQDGNAQGIKALYRTLQPFEIYI